VDVVIQNPRERVVLLQHGKNASAVNADGTNARNQHMMATLSPKKLPGSALLPPPVYSSESPEIVNFSSVHYLATDEVFGTIAMCVCHSWHCSTVTHGILRHIPCLQMWFFMSRSWLLSRHLYHLVWLRL